MTEPAASAAVPRWFSTLRHDLRTQMNHVLGYAELLLEEAERPSGALFAPHLEGIRAAGRQAVAVISDPIRQGARAVDLIPLAAALSGPMDRIIRSSQQVKEMAGALGQSDMLPDVVRIEAAAHQARALVATAVGRSKSGGAPPASTADAEAALERPAPDTAVAGVAERGTILVVDDDEANRQLLSRRLKRLGHTVVSAADGREALDVLGSHPVDLVLLDLKMPVMNGYEVLEHRQADERLRDVPVLMLSSQDDLSSVARCLRLGADDYIAKPFEAVLLQARVGASLERKRLRDGERRLLESLRSQAVEPAPLAHSSEIAVVLCDLRGLTELAGGPRAEEVMAALADYHAAMGRLLCVLGLRDAVTPRATDGTAG